MSRTILDRVQACATGSLVQGPCRPHRAAPPRCEAQEQRRGVAPIRTRPGAQGVHALLENKIIIARFG